MILTIGSADYVLGDGDDATRIVDEVLGAARAGAGIVRFVTRDGARHTAVVTPSIPVVVSDSRPMSAVAGGADDVGVSFLELF